MYTSYRVHTSQSEKEQGGGEVLEGSEVKQAHRLAWTLTKEGQANTNKGPLCATEVVLSHANFTIRLCAIYCNGEFFKRESSSEDSQAEDGNRGLTG